MKSMIANLKNKSMNWWASVATILALIVALSAWLWPRNPSPINPPITPQPTTVAQSLQITEPIPARKLGIIRILVAKFDETNQPNYKVTDLIVANLRTALSKYTDTEVIATDRVITERDGSDIALQIGQAYDANIVIWGWYGLTEKAVPLGIHFETLATNENNHPNSCRAVNRQSMSAIRKAAPVELSDLTLQTNLSNELSYVTLFTLGVARYDAGDWLNAVDMFDDALQHLTEETILSAKTEGSGVLVDQSLLFYYEGKAQYQLKNYSLALDYFRKIPTADHAIYLDIAKALAGQGKNDEALDAYNYVIENGESQLVTSARYNRGFLFEKLGNFDAANKDFTTAITQDQQAVPELDVAPINKGNILDSLKTDITSNPQNPLYYYWRGVIFQDGNQNEEALKDFNKAISLLQNFYLAREARSHVLVNLDMYQETISDLNYIFQAKEFRTPCNLQNRGVSYSKLHNPDKAIKDFTEIISTTTKTINENPGNAYAYYVRYLAYTGLGNKSFLVRISPFDLNKVNALKDLMVVRRIERRNGSSTVLANNKDIVLAMLMVLLPYVAWISALGLLITSKDDLVAWYRRRFAKKGRKHHPH